MRKKLAISAIIVALVLIPVVAFSLTGPERLWRLFGEPDLGRIEFGSLTRRSSPNDALACPTELCKARSDLVPPFFAIGVDGLRNAMAKVLTSEPRLTLVRADDATLTDRYVQRSAILGFPDTIVIRYIDQPEERSTLAIYSRSQIGYGDLGANRARIERWLGKLRQRLPIVE